MFYDVLYHVLFISVRILFFGNWRSKDSVLIANCLRSVLLTTIMFLHWDTSEVGSKIVIFTVEANVAVSDNGAGAFPQISILTD